MKKKKVKFCAKGYMNHLILASDLFFFFFFLTIFLEFDSKPA